MSSSASKRPSPPAQLSLALPAPAATGDTPLVPVRMVNEWVYCPRLAFLEWVDGEWADFGDTEEGRRAHVRVDCGRRKTARAGGGRRKARFLRARRDARLRAARYRRKNGSHRGRGRHRHPDRHQEGQAPTRRRRSLGARAGPGLRPGADPRGRGLPGRRRRDLVRRLARAGAHRARR